MQITIDKLTKTYGKNPPSLDQVTLTIGRGMFGLLGPNGAGKSTLMQILATLGTPTSGTVQVGPYRIGKDDQHIREIIGYLPQKFGLYKKLTAYEYLDYVALMKGLANGKQRKQAIMELLERVNLTRTANKKIGSFSGGMKQRVGIAQALLGNPQVLIVDEPTVGLDPEERIRFRNMLSEWSASRIVLFSTHIVGDIENSCSQLAIMRKGKVLFHGSQDELLSQTAGSVWIGTIPETALPSLREQAIVVSARSTAAGQEVRLIAGRVPFSGAVPAAPGLEDAYMRVIGGQDNA